MAKDPRTNYAKILRIVCGPPEEPPGKGRIISIQEYMPAGKTSKV